MMTRLAFGPAIGTSFTFVALLAASACEVPAEVDESRAASERSSLVVEDRHLLLIVERARSDFRIAEAHVVATPLPRTRAPRWLGWRADVEGPGGRIVFSDTMAESGIRRSVFMTADGGTEAVEMRPEVSSFALRVPFVPNAARIRFWNVISPPSEEPAFGAHRPEDEELGVVAYPSDVR